jgi:hypothetical protein
MTLGDTAGHHLVGAGDGQGAELAYRDEDDVRALHPGDLLLPRDVPEGPAEDYPQPVHLEHVDRVPAALLPSGRVGERREPFETEASALLAAEGLHEVLMLPGEGTEAVPLVRVVGAQCHIRRGGGFGDPDGTAVVRIRDDPYGIVREEEAGVAEPPDVHTRPLRRVFYKSSYAGPRSSAPQCSA